MLLKPHFNICFFHYPCQRIWGIFYFLCEKLDSLSIKTSSLTLKLYTLQSFNISNLGKWLTVFHIYAAYNFIYRGTFESPLTQGYSETLHVSTIPAVPVCVGGGSCLLVSMRLKAYSSCLTLTPATAMVGGILAVVVHPGIQLKHMHNTVVSRSFLQLSCTRGQREIKWQLTNNLNPLNFQCWEDKTREMDKMAGFKIKGLV